MDRLNENARAWLQAEGRTRQELAEMIGCTASALDSHLAGKTDWTWGEACALADVLGCSLSDLR